MGGFIIPHLHLHLRRGRGGPDHHRFSQSPVGFFPPPSAICAGISGVTAVQLRRVTLKHARSGVTALNKAQILPVGITVTKAPY